MLGSNPTSHPDSRAESPIAALLEDLLNFLSASLKTQPVHMPPVRDICAYCNKEIEPYDEVTKKGGTTMSGFVNIYHYHKECAAKVTPP